MTDNNQKSNLIVVLNGPNLNLLGTREPTIYGTQSLDDIEHQLTKESTRRGVTVECKQSNHEGQLIDWLHHAARAQARAIILNAGGYTHTSVALHDAIAAIETPVIEVHLSNISAREDFRQGSLTGRVAKGSISGFGALSYLLALEAALTL